MAIPQSFLDELIARTDIVELVSSYVKLIKRSGANRFGLCPFHSEKSPSFSVSTDKQIYHCFGCGIGGGAINFVMEIENLPFTDAVDFLARRAGMTVPETTDDDTLKRRNRMLELNREAARFFHAQLTAPAGKSAVSYMQKRRISPKIARTFGIGCAPDSWDALGFAMKAKGFTESDLTDAGLAKFRSKGGGIYDVFRDRLIFPVIDIRGNVIGFSGRILSDGEPKYLNSPDTLVFSKSRNLFALNIAKKAKSGMLILVEGNIDVVALHDAGIDCAVASLGTALTDEQARLMSRFTDRVVICYDSDAAGVKATARAITILEKTGLDVRVLDLPGAKDPDEYIVKNGADSFLNLLNKSENHVEYRLRGIAADHNLETNEGRVSYLSDAIAALAAIDSAPEREVFGRTVATQAGVSYDAVELEIKKVRAIKAKKNKTQQQRDQQRLTSAVQPADRALRYTNEYSAVAEEGILRSVLSDPEAFNTVRKLGLTREEFTSPLLGAAFEALRLSDERGERMEQATLLATFSPSEASHLTRVLLLPANTPESGSAAGPAYMPVTASASDRAVSDYINKIREEKLKHGDDISAALLAVRERKQRKDAGYE